MHQDCTVLSIGRPNFLPLCSSGVLRVNRFVPSVTVHDVFTTLGQRVRRLIVRLLDCPSTVPFDRVGEIFHQIVTHRFQNSVMCMDDTLGTLRQVLKLDSFINLHARLYQQCLSECCYCLTFVRFTDCCPPVNLFITVQGMVPFTSSRCGLIRTIQVLFDIREIIFLLFLFIFSTEVSIYVRDPSLFMTFQGRCT